MWCSNVNVQNLPHSLSIEHDQSANSAVTCSSMLFVILFFNRVIFIMQSGMASPEGKASPTGGTHNIFRFEEYHNFHKSVFCDGALQGK